MALFISSLNSGSNGNCYYIGNNTEAVLVDAGISCKEIETRMKRLGLNMELVKAIFVSHEHTDHIKGIPIFAKKYRLPVYITEATRIKGRLKLEKQQAISFEPGKAVQIAGLEVMAFPKQHDAADPYSFSVAYNGIRVGIFTDIGSPCQNLVSHFKQCHAAFLEANYDEEMLDKGNYPYYLKTRIRGGKGHLSNAQALSLFLEHRPAFLSHLLLSHLSKHNNSPELVQQLFDQHANGVKIIVASREVESPLFQIMAAQDGNQPLAEPLISPVAEQMSFSFE